MWPKAHDWLPSPDGRFADIPVVGQEAPPPRPSSVADTATTSMRSRRQEQPGCTQGGTNSMSELNDQVIAEFRANDGIVRDALGGFLKGIHLLLLYHVGRRS